MRQDDTGGHFLNWWYRGKTTVFWYHCLRKFGKNLGKIWDGTGLLSSTWESLKWSQNLGLRQDGKKPVPNDGTESGPGRGCSRTFMMVLFPFFMGNIWFLGNGIRECRPLFHMFGKIRVSNFKVNFIFLVYIF